MTKGSIRYFRYFTFIPPIGHIPFVKNYGPTTVTILVMIIFILFAIKPTVESIVVLQKKVEDANKVLKQIDQKTNDLNAAKQNFDSLNESTIFKIQKAIPDTITLNTIAQSLEQSAHQNGASISALQLQSITIEPKKENQVRKLAEVEFTFNIEGTYPKLISVLEDLKKTNRLITINSLSFRNTEEQNPNLVMSIRGKTYFLK